MDSDSKELVEITARGLAEGTARATLGAFFGPLIEATGMVTDELAHLRWKRRVKIAMRAEGFLRQLNVVPNQIPPKLGVPILERGWLDEDDDMISRWAALLANAAAGERGVQVLPSFPAILAELSPEEAMILDVAYTGAAPGHPYLFVGHDHESWRATVGLPNDSSFDTRLFNLDRLNLLEVSYETSGGDRDDDPLVQRPYLVQSTPLGFAFVAACRPPG